MRGQPNDTPKFVSLSVDPAGKAFLNDQPVTDEELAAQPSREGRRRAARTPRCNCAPTRPCPTARVVALMGIANKAGLSRIGFVTEAPPTKPPR